MPAPPMPSSLACFNTHLSSYYYIHGSRYVCLECKLHLISSDIRLTHYVAFTHGTETPVVAAD